LQKLDRDIVGRPDKGHPAVARGARDGDAIVHQVLAKFVDIIDAVGEMAEMAAVGGQAVIAVPVIGQFQPRLFAGTCEKDIGEAARLAVVAAQLLQAQKVVEGQRFLEVQNPNHRVVIFDAHRVPFLPFGLA